MMPDNKEASDKAGDEPANEMADESHSPDASNASDDAHSDQPEGEALSGESLDSDEQPGNQAGVDENAEPEDELTMLKNQLAEAEAKASEHWDRLLRLQAEMENQRKRAQNDVTKARKFALEGIVNDLLPIKDSLEMGLAAATAEEAEAGAIVEGAQLTLNMLGQVFEKIISSK